MPPAPSSIGCPSASRHCPASARCLPLLSSRRRQPSARSSGSNTDQADGQTMPTALITTATPSYFETLRVPLRAGRIMSPADRLDTPPVAMINQAFAARYLAGTDPLGQRLALGSPDQQRPWTTIVGVVADYRNSGVTQPVRPEIYIPVRQQTAWNQLFMLIRTDGSPTALLPVRAPDRLIARSRTAGLSHPDARRGAGHVVVSAAYLGGAPEHLRRRRARARRDRHLRRDVLRGDRAHAGDGRASGHRRAAPRRHLARPRPGPAPVGDRPGDRDRSRASPPAARSRACSSACAPPIPPPSRR